MSASLLHHGFSLVGHRYVRQEFQEAPVIFHIGQPRERLRCFQGGSAGVWAQGDAGQPPARGPRLRFLPRDQVVQRQAPCAPRRVVSPTEQR
jgi:hypothetical protein